MFTGIIEELGHVRQRNAGSVSSSLTIAAREVLQGTRIGDSIAVNGVCLTVTQLLTDAFVADVMNETFRHSNLGGLTLGQAVNLERALLPTTRMGGHYVTGHIDATAKITRYTTEGIATWIEMRVPTDLARGIVPKGSIALDGVSLTVARTDGRGMVAVSVIPHTSAVTTLTTKGVGAVLNVETDILGKYVAQMLGHHAKANSELTMNDLKNFL